MESDSITKISGAAVIIAFFFMLASCNPTAEELQAKAALVEAETKQLQVEENAVTQRENNMLTRMHALLEDRKISPFAARCAVYGPSQPTSLNSQRLCAQASGVKVEE